MPVTVYSWDDRRTQEQVERQVTASVRFTGSGRATRATDPEELCWDVASACRSVSLDTSRPAAAGLTPDDAAASGAGSVSYRRTILVGGAN